MGIWKAAKTGDAHVDFDRWWRVGLIASAVALVISLAALGVRQLNLGIEFEGGTSWEYVSDESIADVRDTLSAFGLEQAKIQTVGDDTVRVQADISDRATVVEVTDALAEAAGIDPLEVSVTVIGPTWGGEITDAAIKALVVFFFVIAAYMAIRLEWRMAVAALVAVVHDIIITVGVYALFQFLVTPGTVIAVLTILGFSLYDTVVVFDRARDNGVRYASSGRLTYRQVMELSVNQVLVRSVNTSIVTLLPVICMLGVGSLALGAAPLQEFAIALAVGLLVGAYSSIFVAAPVVIWMKEREPRWRQIRQRVEARAASGEAPASEPAEGDEKPRTRSGAATAPTAGAATATPASTWSGNHPPRPRKGKGKGKSTRR
jgi:preprotein translocase subunit SecF